MEMDFNGVGPEIESFNRGLPSSHALWLKVWVARCSRDDEYGFAFRPTELYDFSERASNELEKNAHATACAKCLSGSCEYYGHWTSDPTGNKIYWSRYSYASIDHLTNRMKKEQG